MKYLFQKWKIPIGGHGRSFRDSACWKLVWLWKIGVRKSALSQVLSFKCQRWINRDKLSLYISVLSQWRWWMLSTVMKCERCDTSVEQRKYLSPRHTSRHVFGRSWVPFLSGTQIFSLSHARVTSFIFQFCISESVTLIIQMLPTFL